MTATDARAELRLGRILTFYSYKGGTGRSMALANIAWILASAGNKVLMVDWDLEAPGLHRYLHPFLPDPDLVESEGLVDFFLEFAAAAVSDSRTDDDLEWFQSYTNILDYAHSIDYNFGGDRRGFLDLVPAGRQDEHYSVRVNGFNWDRFYTAFGGGVFLEAVKQRLRAEYDYVLIDSRTGVSDTAGICTVQMPDDLIACFTLNRQSLAGCAAVARSAFAQRQRAEAGMSLQIWPVPTRIEDAEKKKRDQMQALAMQAFDDLIGQVAPEARDRYWGEVGVRYLPFYAYEEVLAVFGDRPYSTGSMLGSMEAITRYLSRGRVSAFAPLSEEARRAGLEKYFGREPGPTKAPSEIDFGTVVSPTPKKYLFYISYAHSDFEDATQRFVDDLFHEVSVLTGQKADGFFDRSSLNRTEALSMQLEQAILNASTFVALISPSYLRRNSWGREVDLFQSTRRTILPVIWVPVDSAALPEVLSSQQLCYDGLPSAYAERGLRQLQRLTRYRSEYYETVSFLANRIVEFATAPPRKPMPPRSDLARERLRQLVRAYATIREALSSGPERTSRMEQIAAEMRELAHDLRHVLPELFVSEEPGERLAAITILQVAPDVKYLDWLASSVDPQREKPFVGYHAAVALRIAVRELPATELERIEASLQRALLSTRTRPDSDRDRTLKIALTELKKRRTSEANE